MKNEPNRVIRSDDRQLVIKVKSYGGQYSHGWKTLEKFVDKVQLDKRFSELLKDPFTIQG